jgi:predicted lipoprotein with Yx(FWY)xxD motif
VRAIVRLLFAAAALVITGCGSGTHPGSSTAATRGTPSVNSSSSTGPTADSAPATSATTSATTSARSSSGPAHAGVVIAVGASPYGPVLFDGTGRAVYTFGAERTSTPACYDDCARSWPPVLTTGRPTAAVGVHQGVLGLTKRADGTTQATYGGQPLYFYVHDGRHQVLCHNVVEFGGRWLAISATGVPAPV